MDITGVYTAVATPFTEADTVDVAALRVLVEHVIAGGGEGIVALGTMGDGLAVTVEERREILAVTAETTAGRAGLVAGATAVTTRDAIAHSVLAGELGYDAVMIAPPPYVLPTAAELVDHYRAIADSAGIPILMYDYPDRVGVSIGFDVLDELADVPQIIGVKEASGDMARVIGMRRRYGDRYEIVCGADTLIVDFALWGCRGWIAGASGFLPDEHVEILALASSGQFIEAKEKLAPLLAMIMEMESGGYSHKVRTGLAAAGLPCGATRAPLRPLSPADRNAFLRLVPTHDRT